MLPYIDYIAYMDPSWDMIWGEDEKQQTVFTEVLPGSLPDIHDISEPLSIGSNELGSLIMADVRGMRFLGPSDQWGLTSICQVFIRT
jgi:hypothetical protein